MSNAAWEYAQATLALADVEGSEAAAVFDMALTNGLVAIVASDWPGEVAVGKHVKSARALLEVVEAHCGLDASDVATITSSDGTTTSVAVADFREALDRTKPVRHGSGGDGRVTPAEVEALRDLDHHPALRRLLDVSADRRSARAIASDAAERGRAYDYLRSLSDDEIERRVPLAREDAPFDPKDFLEWNEPQECPVCWQEALVVDAVDDYGHGIGSGTCVVCSYRRSRAMVDEMSLDEEFQRWE